MYTWDCISERPDHLTSYMSLFLNDLVLFLNYLLVLRAISVYIGDSFHGKSMWKVMVREDLTS